MTPPSDAPPELLQTTALRDAFAEDLLAALQSSSRRVPSKYLYDEQGSKLFEQICEQPEYYLTRAERAILHEQGDEIAGQIGPGCVLIELGSGSSRKTQLLLDKLDAPLAYVPVDISPAALLEASGFIESRFPGLAVEPVAADYTVPEWRLPRSVPAGSSRLFLFAGSSIGNFEPPEARNFLARVRSMCGPDDGLLIGVDLTKDVTTLEAAYNDAAGVTAAFNLNLLVRANRELGANFDPQAFAHAALFNESASRIEMHLVCLDPQRVQLGTHTFRIQAEDDLVTEHSYKYRVDEFQALAGQAGFKTRACWTDPGEQFSLHHLAP